MKNMPDFEMMKSLGEIKPDEVEEDEDTGIFDGIFKWGDDQRKKSVTEIFKNQLIRRSPDKMIDYMCGFILLAYRNRIIYLDVRKYQIDSEDSRPDLVEATIQDEDYDFLELKNKYKIIAM